MIIVFLQFSLKTSHSYLLNSDAHAKPLIEEDGNIDSYEDRDIKHVKEDLGIQRSLAELLRNILHPVIFPFQLLQSQLTFDFQTCYVNDYIEVV